MCEQTEINYLDGDVVWVKLGACWWPGQVTGFHNLPEDIQTEFQKKPLIAVVKFFQEDTYEFVKNYQQIYKYNCTQKDEFIRKGLDKYRSKSKDGSRYMDKFPGDVEMAEKLTGGDPDILSQEKFCPEEKPDISALFGDKKVTKKKKDRDDMHRRSDSMDVVRKITHPRFLKESDHEVRIRQQPRSLPSTPNNTGSPQYPCHLCSFTSSRVNVIICHIKSHRSGNSPTARSKVKSISQHRSRVSDSDTPKRKYARKEKTTPKSRNESHAESGKRKQPKQIEKANKKKKTDPKIRDTILADWEDESDEDISMNTSKLADTSTMSTLSTRTDSDTEIQDELDKKNNSIPDGSEIIAETEKLLKETEKLTSIHSMDSLADNVSVPKPVKSNQSDESIDMDDDSKISDSAAEKATVKTQKGKESSSSDTDTKYTSSDKSDKKSLLSCFDFHEEELSIPPVRKKGRAFHQKKEIIKEFEMSQALKNEQEREAENKKLTELEQNKKAKTSDVPEEIKSSTNNQDSNEVEKSTSNMEETVKSDIDNKTAKSKAETVTPSSENLQKSTTQSCETELEIVEIFEVEREEPEEESSRNTEESAKDKVKDDIASDVQLANNKMPIVENNEPHMESKSISDDKQLLHKDTTVEGAIIEAMEQASTKETEETLSERFTTETEDETVSESAETLPEQSENSDADMFDPDRVPQRETSTVSLSSKELTVAPETVKKRRGRPRKNVGSTGGGGGIESDHSKVVNDKNLKKVTDTMEIERRTSESDTERSYTGRRRKPNKKYLESDIYVQDVDQRVFRTDESQSESDDRTPERVKGRSKRGRKSSGVDKRKTEPLQHIDEKELEITHMLDVLDKTSAVSKADASRDSYESSANKDKSLIQEEVKLTDNQTSVHVMEVLTDSVDEGTLSKDISTYSSSEEPKVPLEDNSLKPQDDTLQLSNEDDKAQHQKPSEQEKLREESKDQRIESMETTELKHSSEKEELSQTMETMKHVIDMLPPKKSQIKKFELSQIDFFEGDSSMNKSTVESDTTTAVVKSKDLKLDMCKDGSITEVEDKPQLEKVDVVPTVKEINVEAIEEKAVKQTEEIPFPEKKEEFSVKEETSEKLQLESSTSEGPIKDTSKTSVEKQVVKSPSMQTRYKGKVIPETGASGKKEVLEEKAVNTFQEAFLKTLHMDKKKGLTGDSESATWKGKRTKKTTKRKLEEQDSTNSSSSTLIHISKAGEVLGQIESSGNASNVHVTEGNAQISGTSILEANKAIKIEQKIQEGKIEEGKSSLAELESKSLIRSQSVEDSAKSITLDIQKIDESSRMSTSTPSPSSDATIPVKKREMPRIIENVTLTEPMQILKSKLLDKIPQKGVKHKLDSDVVKKSDHKGSSKAKIMKIESLPSNSKSKSGQKIASPHMSLSKKIQVLKAGDAEATMLDVQSEQRNIHTAQSATPTSVSDKYIQQSSQSLAEMELDINSMPFVLSDDVLTPESIEQMPVVISSIIASSSTIPATLSFTTTTQAGSASATQLKLTESSGEVSPSKKKSGTPAILKTKNKAKPTITSIKTLVPPLTGGVKGIKFQNTQAAKTPPLLAQKSTPGKYVVVQTSGGPQVRYSVQGKPGTQQKIAIPAGKSAANAQVVQQGGKVVILTSAQSGQTKMLPLNISKTLGGKVQRIVTNKGQVLCPVSPQGIGLTSKTILASKGDGTSPTTSKLASGHKIINTQGIITSKSVLTSLSGTIGKTTLLGTLSQGILTKGGICMPINASTLGGKTIIGSKALVTKGATLLSSQNLGTSKAILTTMSPTIAGKTILSTQGIMGTKGTIVTPITGQQVKAIAAKSPGKGSKVQYQSVQQKVQLPMLQKAQKVSVSPSTQMRPGQLKPATSTLVLQNTSPSQKTLLPGKKVVKQVIVQQGTTLQNIAAQGAPQQSMGIVQQMQQKGKAASGSAVQKVIIPRGAGRQTKSQQKLMVQKVQEPSISTVHNVQQKQSHRTSSTNLAASKSAQQKSSAGISTPTKSGKAHGTSKAAQQQKNLLQVAMSTGTTTNVSTTITTPLSLPPLETIEPEKKHKVENVITEIVKDQSKIEKVNLEKSTETEKVEEPKVTAQPQIMALPTESSDGTQTYVLVTIDEQGQIQPLDNNTLMSLEGTTQNPDGTRTLYIDPSSLGDAGTIDNIVLQFDNGVLPNIQTSGTESTQAIVSERFPTSEVIQTSNQDILAAALANTDFQQEINLSETSAANVMNPGLTQTSLINQTILQSTIIPPTEPISSPSVLETSLTLNQPIMTPLEVPSSLPIQSETTSTSGVPTIPSSLELPITITNPNISYISAGEAQIQIPGNSMPDIGGIIESASTVESGPAENSAGTQYLVIPNLDENMSVESQNVETSSIPMPSVSYSVSIPNDIVIESQQVQTTPSMPIIDDTYTENIPFSTTMKSSIPMDQQSFVDVPVSEMLVTKTTAATENLQTPDVTVTSEIAATTDAVVSSQETIVSTNETTVSQQEQDVYSSQEVPISSEELILQQTVAKEDSSSNVVVATEGADVSNNESTVSMPIAEQTSESMTSSMPIIDETSLVTSDSNVKMSSVEHISFEVTDSSGIETDDSQESKAADKFKQLSFTEQSAEKVHSPVAEEQAATSNEADMVEKESEVLPTKSQNELDEEKVTTETDTESQLCVASTVKQADECQGDEPSSQAESALEQRNLELHFDEISEETSHETPSQSYDKFGISVTSGSADLPSQSASKSENSREPSQSVSYEAMETDEDPTATEPPTQSFEHSKINEASQSYETSGEASTNAPTQSFNEVMQTQEETSTVEEVVDDQTFPTQSYEVDKPENTSENLETDAEISQEGNIPSQSNDIGADGIGTSSVSTNNSGLNEDETASSSYVPETPENQERDQDQESAISTSSYEIPPCEELNIASSSVIPDTSVRAEHTSIHDNGVPEIPTSSYNLNPDITSTHVDSVPTSSYEDQVIVEQNVSTSYEVPISMPGLEETCSQNFVTESTDHRNEPSSYYGHHQEVTASYYETVDQETNSRLEGDAQEEATPSYYEGNPQEASQSYFNPEEASQSYSGGHNVSASYYDPRPEGEASQSYYSTDDIEKTEQSSSQNIEASQSFYQEQSDEMKLQQQGEATPTYSESYPVDYTLDNSPIERHDLVESSVPATRPTER